MQVSVNVSDDLVRSRARELGMVDGPKEEPVAPSTVPAKCSHPRCSDTARFAFLRADGSANNAYCERCMYWMMCVQPPTEQTRASGDCACKPTPPPAEASPAKVLTDHADMGAYPLEWARQTGHDAR